MSTLEVNTIDTVSGNANLTIGGSNNTGSTTIKTNNTNAVTIDNSQNLQFNSGFGSVATAYGVRAWVNFNGSSTVAIRGSRNVSSITDDGTGKYTVNFTTAMPDDDYCVTVNHAEDSGDAYSNFGAGSRVSAFNGNPDRTTTSFAIATSVDESNFTDMHTIEAIVVR